MKTKLLLMLVAFGLMAGGAQAAYSTWEVTIDNASFEDPIISEGGFNSTFIDWIEVFTGGVAGVTNLSIDLYGGIAPDGVNVVYCSGGQYIYQILTETVAAETTYELTVEVGRHHLQPDLIDYQIQLWAGGTLLAEDDSSLAIAENTFETSTVTYASGATPAQLGEPLEIRLLSEGGELNFDDVRLTATTGLVREPSPADDADNVQPAENLELSWTNMDPNELGDSVYVDVWFGMDPNDNNDFNKIVDATTPAGEDASSVTVNVSIEGIYYWQVNSYISADHINEPNMIPGPLWRFLVINDVPISSVTLGPDMITWSGQTIQLAPTVVDDGTSALTFAWSADPDDGVVFTPNDGGDGSTSSAENPTVTLTQWAYSEATILNAGFEDPVLADGGWNSTFIDWTEIFGGGVAGVDNPDPTRYGGIAFEGSNHMYASGGSGAYQVLAETVEADTTYELTVVVGVSSTDPIEYQVQLWAGGTLLAEDDSSLTIAEDTFETSTVTHTSGGVSDPNVGEALEIRLVSPGSEVNFDDVHLTADPPFSPPVPQPVTLTLLVNDDVSSAEGTRTIDVYDNSCQATIIGAGITEATDFDGDCDTDLEDFAVMALMWLDDYRLTEPVEKP